MRKRESYTWVLALSSPERAKRLCPISSSGMSHNRVNTCACAVSALLYCCCKQGWCVLRCAACAFFCRAADEPLEVTCPKFMSRRFCRYEPQQHAVPALLCAAASRAADEPLELTSTSEPKRKMNKKK